MSGADEAGEVAVTDEAGADPATDKAGAEVAADDAGATAAADDGGVTAAADEAGAPAATDGAEVAAATGSAEPPAEAGDAGQTAAEPVPPEAEGVATAGGDPAGDATVTEEAAPAQAEGAPTAVEGAPEAVPVEETPTLERDGAQKADEGASEVAPQAVQGAGAPAPSEEPQAVQETALPEAEDATKASEEAAAEAAQSAQDAVPEDGQQAVQGETPQGEGSPETGQDPTGEAPQDAQELAPPETDDTPIPADEAPGETALTSGEVAPEASEAPKDGEEAPGDGLQTTLAAAPVGQEVAGTSIQPAQDLVSKEEKDATVPQTASQESLAAQEVTAPSGDGGEVQKEAAQSVPDAPDLSPAAVPVSAMAASQGKEALLPEVEDQPPAAKPDSSEAMQRAAAALAGHALQISGEESTETVPATSASLEPEEGDKVGTNGISPLTKAPIALDPWDGYAADAKASSVTSPQSANRKSIKTKPVPTAQNPGVVIYVICPMMASEATLTNEEFTAIAATGLRSDASIVLSARSSESVVALDQDTVGVDRILRPLAEFAISRFSTPGSSKAGPQRTAFAQLFDALVQPGRSEVSVAALAQGLHALGYRGDAEAAAEATLGEGLQRVSRRDFCDALSRVSELPEIIAVSAANQAPLASSLKSKKRNSQSDSSQESSWPVVRMVQADDFELAGDVALQAKVDEAVRIAGPAGYGVILLLTGRGRTLLRPTEYERQMRAELQFAAEGLPSDWPLLWYPGPAEVGFLPAGNSPQRPNWAMPQASRPEDLQGWLRYLLSVRPLAPVV